jgi:RNA polymerase sigma-70 factor (ECF subfamily)
LEDVEAAPPQPGDLVLPLETTAYPSGDSKTEVNALSVVAPAIPQDLAERLWRTAEGSACGISPQEFANILDSVGKRCNHGLPTGIDPSPTQKLEFYSALRLAELALAHACAMGCEIAWERLLSQYRNSVTQAATAITRSASLGQDLANSLYAELFGLKDREGCRISPLASYSGRGSLLGWLRTTLAQRHIDFHRRTHREEPLEDVDPPASPIELATHEIDLLGHAVARTLKALDATDSFLLSSYFLDGRTLIEIARLLKVHEATISRRLKRLVEQTRKQLLQNLRAEGLSERQAEEALGTDPRDLEINLRSMLQKSLSVAFSDQAPPARQNSQ